MCYCCLSSTVANQSLIILHLLSLSTGIIYQGAKIVCEGKVASNCIKTHPAIDSWATLQKAMPMSMA